MSETAYWVWLQCALGEGAAVQPLLEEFGSAKAVYDCLLYTSPSPRD